MNKADTSGEGPSREGVESFIDRLDDELNDLPIPERTATELLRECRSLLSLLSREKDRAVQGGEDVHAALVPTHDRWTDPRFRSAHTIDIIVRKDARTHIYEGDWLKDVARALVPCVRCVQGFKLVGDNHVYYTTRGNQSYEHFELCRIRADTLPREAGPSTPDPQRKGERE